MLGCFSNKPVSTLRVSAASLLWGDGSEAVTQADNDDEEESENEEEDANSTFA